MCSQSYTFVIHRSLHSSRDAISDAPALYFVVPNRENIARICQVSELVLSRCIDIAIYIMT